MSTFNNRLEVAPKLYSEKLINKASFDDAVDKSPCTDITKGTSLAKAVNDTINNEPQLITKLISIFKKLEPFNLLANELSNDLCL